MNELIINDHLQNTSIIGRGCLQYLLSNKPLPQNALTGEISTSANVTICTQAIINYTTIDNKCALFLHQLSISDSYSHLLNAALKRILAYAIQHKDRRIYTSSKVAKENELERLGFKPLGQEGLYYIERDNLANALVE
ncbi:MAG: hypothetical protein IJD40_07605 [Lachnospiraceae bacterium]|nr:hypothetical protein [Lachnospiraceae bacterium]